MSDKHIHAMSTNNGLIVFMMNYDYPFPQETRRVQYQEK